MFKIIGKQEIKNRLKNKQNKNLHRLGAIRATAKDETKPRWKKKTLSRPKKNDKMHLKIEKTKKEIRKKTSIRTGIRT